MRPPPEPLTRTSGSYALRIPSEPRSERISVGARFPVHALKFNFILFILSLSLPYTTSRQLNTKQPTDPPTTDSHSQFDLASDARSNANVFPRSSPRFPLPYSTFSFHIFLFVLRLCQPTQSPPHGIRTPPFTSSLISFFYTNRFLFLSPVRHMQGRVVPSHQYPRHRHSTYNTCIYIYPLARRGHGDLITNLYVPVSRHPSPWNSRLHCRCLFSSSLPSYFPLCLGRHLHSCGHDLIYSTDFRSGMPSRVIIIEDV